MDELWLSKHELFFLFKLITTYKNMPRIFTRTEFWTFLKGRPATGLELKKPLFFKLVRKRILIQISSNPERYSFDPNRLNEHMKKADDGLFGEIAMKTEWAV